MCKYCENGYDDVVCYLPTDNGGVDDLPAVKMDLDLFNYNKPCNNYIMDTELREHLIKLLKLDNKDGDNNG